MTEDRIDLGFRIFAGPGVWTAFGILTIPFVAATVDARLTTPLAGPGYTLFVGLTIVGERIVPKYAFVVYWGPFFIVSYVLSIIVAASVRAIRQ